MLAVSEVGMRAILLLMVGALACQDGAPGATKGGLAADGDSDGVPAGEDCDDRDRTVAPGAPERCDGKDNDCDGIIDESGGPEQPLWYADGDGDGVGAGAAVAACVEPAGHVAQDGDCDDGDAAVRPGATDTCDGVDSDCDGEIDEDGATLWYADGDGDGWGAPADPVAACAAPDGTVGTAGDCDDGDPAVSPGAAEVCGGGDEDCDGLTDEADAADAVLWAPDADGDGFGAADGAERACTAPLGYVADTTDCDDGDAGVSPAALEVCGGADEDCDGLTDEPDAADAVSWFLDADADGWGDPGAGSTACDAPAGHVADAGDCDDGDAGVSPAALEVCGGGDEDCDGQTDEPDAADAPRWYADADADTFGDPSVSVPACAAPAGFSATATDCDDGDPAVRPGAAERWYDGADQDCAGDDDFDADADTFRAEAHGGTDCDDGDAAVRPGAADTWYDGVDQDCLGDDDFDADADGLRALAHGGADCDDGDAAVRPGAAERWYDGVDQDCAGDDDFDADADTFRASAHGGADCDDANPAISPAALEVCGGVDEDCDGTTDEPDAADAPTWYTDADADGHGAGASRGRSCTPLPGAAPTADDCNDADPAVSPSDPEICGGADEDCDGTTDEPDALGAPLWYTDADGDTYGLASTARPACVAPAGTVSRPGDCDDTRAAISPAAAEVCGGVDEDCDGTTDEPDALGAPLWYTDADGDTHGDPATVRPACTRPSGTVSRGDDCDDADPAERPGVTWSPDADGDGFGDPEAPTTTCARAASTDVADATDCDDTRFAVNPDAAEVCRNGLDDDCDGTANTCTLGSPTDLSRADARLTGELPFDYAGTAVGGGQDLDGDGYTDVIIGAFRRDRGGTDAGNAYLLFGPLSGTIALSAADGIRTGESAFDHAGFTVALVPDTDRDGLAEALVAAPNDDDGGSNAGAVYLLRGALTGTASLSGAAAKFIGEDPSDRAGDAIAPAGDTDGDGRADLLIGAPAGNTAYLLLAPHAGTQDLSTADAIFTGLGRLGGSVAGVGDVDGDGHDDLLIGAPGDDTAATDAGAAYLIAGPVSGVVPVATAARATIRGAAAAEALGTALAAPGDVDADGFADVLLGLPGRTTSSRADGAVAYLRGPFSGTASVDTAATTLWRGQGTGSAGDALGTALAAPGDVDGDGAPELLLGAPGAGTTGAAWLLSGAFLPAAGRLGPTAAVRFDGPTTALRLGAALAPAGDTDGDGYFDLLLGAPEDSGPGTGAGAAFLVRGTGL